MTKITPKNLTPKDELHVMEHEIETNWAVAAAKLQAIKDRELWRQDGYNSWKDYCERRWKKNRATMYQLLDDAKVCQDVKEQLVGEKTSVLLENGEGVSDYSDTLPPANPAQARALSKVPVAHRLKVLKDVQESGKASAKAITQSACEIAHKAKPTEVGKPKYALSVWKDLQEYYGHALNRIHDAHRAVPNAERRDHMLKTTKALMSDAEIWQEEAR
jgi:hypothetical protein